MVDGLEINNRLFANRGVIGRRDYALNIAILSVVILLFTIPVNCYMTSHIFSAASAVQTNIVFFDSPFWVKALYMLSAAIYIVFGISNAKRRITDIYGKENDIFKYIFSTIIVFKSISLCFPALSCCFIEFLHFVVLIFLLFKKGDITSKLPYDATKVFNFGAFFGTWIWGLINKVYYPLWYILLFFTPFSFCFALICGLKGNEWALKAKNYDDIEKFNSKQENQGIVFGIISILIIPTIAFFLYMGLIVFMITGFTKNPQEAEKVMNSIQNTYMEIVFSECKIEKHKNICYVRDDAWEGSNYKTKTDILEFAATYAADKKNKNISKDDYKNRLDKYDELPKTKLYSEDKSQLIAEYVPSQNKKENLSFVEYVRETANAYRFYPISK